MAKKAAEKKREYEDVASELADAINNVNNLIAEAYERRDTHVIWQTAGIRDGPGRISYQICRVTHMNLEIKIEWKQVGVPDTTTADLE